MQGEIISLNPEDVLSVRASGKHCVLHTFEGDREVACTLAELEGKLPDQFIRVHRSYIVNRSHMRTFGAEGIELVDGTRVPVPAKRRAQLRRLLVG